MQNKENGLGGANNRMWGVKRTKPKRQAQLASSLTLERTRARPVQLKLYLLHTCLKTKSYNVKLVAFLVTIPLI